MPTRMTGDSRCHLPDFLEEEGVLRSGLPHVVFLDSMREWVRNFSAHSTICLSTPTTWRGGDVRRKLFRDFSSGP